ncbi:hypothetical protein SAM40697_0418 [Streptomyces ambofaciens]|uniref:Uncharacterized protein n=1 Tax=Streptomyces ambofaciens TaxID=1889 RepID=A0ABN4NZI3_STRAM|nr:hypothetical protein [Streptomyces ambofaciens]ANB04380.1 hypothetical protein SAM40697_0418 [Streptomyces ambofaciens]
MPADPGHTPDPAVVSVSLAAESALLEARMRLLQEAIHAIDTRIGAVSERLQRMYRAPVALTSEQWQQLMRHPLDACLEIGRGL